MTDAQRLALIFQTKGSDPDVAWLISRIDVCAAVLGNMISEYNQMDPKPPFEAYTLSHAMALATFERDILAMGARLGALKS